MSWSAAVAASICGFPALLGVLAVVVLGGASFGWHPFWNEPELTVAEAAALKDLGTLQRLIWDGIDPNTPATVRPRLLTDDAVVATPLEASIGTRTSITLQFLLSHGARMDARERVVITCLAIAEEAREILEVLDKDGEEHPDCQYVRLPWSRD